MGQIYFGGKGGKRVKFKSALTQRAERDRKGVPPKALARARAARRSLPATNVRAFVPVAVSAMRAHLTVRLPNGVALECHDLEGAQVSALIASLAALPCSA